MKKTGKKNGEKEKSNEQHKFYGRKTQTFYFRILMAFSIAISFVLLINTSMTYIFQSRQVQQFEDKNSIIIAQHIQTSVEIMNERVPYPGMPFDTIKSFVTDLIHDDYAFKIYHSLEELCADVSPTLSPEQEQKLKDREIILLDNITLFRLADYYMAMTPRESSSGNASHVLFSIIWTAGVATIILALLVNSFTTLWLTRPIKNLSDAMQEIVKGNFNVKIKVDGEDEIAALQKTFNMMSEKLQENELMSKDFVSTVSHEYKTPIAAISGYATLLYKGGCTHEEQQEYLKIILEQAHRLSELSVSMLQLSRLDNGIVGLEKNHYHLDEQIRNVVVTLEHGWSEKNLELDIELDDVSIFANEQMLYHVWENLISNAIKFTPENGMITIRLAVENKSIVFSVKDTGCGIPEGEIDKIWQRFYKSRSDVNAGGNGLGLPISKRIVELCGGTISVKSIEGKGSEFTVRIPQP